MKPKLFLFSTFLAVLGMGVVAVGANNKTMNKAMGDSQNLLWSQDFSSYEDGGTVQGDYIAKTLGSAKWLYTATAGGNAKYYDIPAGSHASDFSFSYLARYSGADFYNYIEFRNLGPSGANIEFTIHSCGAIYTSMKNGGTEIQETQSWAGSCGSGASGYYGTDEYNSVRFVKKGNTAAIYINGVKTSWYTFDSMSTTTSILFAEYGGGDLGSYYTNFQYEDLSGKPFSFPAFDEDFKNYVNGVAYRHNSDDENNSLVIESNRLGTNAEYNENYLAYPKYNKLTKISYVATISEKPANSGYFYFIIDNYPTSNFEFTIETNSGGSWALIKKSGEVVYHSGNFGTNPEINVGDNLIEIFNADDTVYFAVNNKVCAYYNEVVTAPTAFKICQYGLNGKVLLGNFAFQEMVYLDSIAVTNQTTTFYQNDTFEFDGTVTATMTDGNTADVTSSVTVTPPDLTKVGEAQVKVSYTVFPVTCEVTYSVTVADPYEVTSISLNTTGAKTTFLVGDAFTSEGLVVTANYVKAESAVVTGFTVDSSDVDLNTVGKYDVKVSYGGKDATYEVKVIAKLTSITVENTSKTEFYLGDEFVNPVVTAHYNGQDDKTITTFTCEGFSSATLGDKTITVKYSENGVNVQTSYVVTIKDPHEVVSIAVDTTNAKTTFLVGDAFTSEGLVVTATFTKDNPEAVTGYTVDSSEVNLNKVGEYTVTVTYQNKTATYTVTVQNKPAPAKGGCGGAIATTSILISTVALLGFTILLVSKKRKHE